MNLGKVSSMEDVSLEDVERNSMEYRVLMVYAQRRLPDSKFGQLLEREAKSQEASGLERGETQPVDPAGKDSHLKDQDPGTPNKKQTKKKRPKWTRRLIPSCLRGQPEHAPREKSTSQDAINGHVPKPQVGVEDQTFSAQDPEITRVADRLAEIVDESRTCPGQISFRSLKPSVSLEADGGEIIKLKRAFDEEEDHGLPVFFEGPMLSEELKINTIVSFLKEAGDGLEEKMKKDKTFSQWVSEQISQDWFFRRVVDQVVAEVPVDPTGDVSEIQMQSTKIAYVVEVVARLTAVINQPTNLLLGFGTKYLKENFSPWIQSQGGWDKVFGLLHQ